eukprot:4313187-Amphidinium_carterae.1
MQHRPSQTHHALKSRCSAAAPAASGSLERGTESLCPYAISSHMRKWAPRNQRICSTDSLDS